MLLYDLAKQYSDQIDEIEENLIVLYPHVVEDVYYEKYRQAFQELLQVKPKLANFVITIRKFEFENNLVFELSASQYRGLKNKLEVDDQNYSFNLFPWKKLLGAEIDEYSIVEFDPPFILAVCLYEMTVHGFSYQEVEAKREKVIRDMEELSHGETDLDLDELDDITFGYIDDDFQ